MTFADLLQYRPETFLHHAPLWQTALMIAMLSIEPVKQLWRKARSR